MLVSNIRSERSAASMVKNSSFYIELAKFVQAYKTIINNPNEFLREVNLPLIDEKKELLNWNQFVKIVEGCDLGFKTTPTAADLVVYYNYAIQIGSIDQTVKRLATIDDIADAQKHYYNFVDEAADRAQTEYMRHHKIMETREREAKNADASLFQVKLLNIIFCVLMGLGVFVFCFGIVSFFYDNVIASGIGSIFSSSAKRYIGGAILVILGLIIFIIFNKLYENNKRKYIQLKRATDMIFKRSDETYQTEIVLKRKLDKLQQDLDVVKLEINDKNKTYDVKHNIEVLKSTNKYYQRLCKDDDELEFNDAIGEDKNELSDEDFAPIKLTKEQEENLRIVSKEAINLEGQFDDEAYNEKFEKSKEERIKEEQEELEKENKRKAQMEEEEKQKQDALQAEQEGQNAISEQELAESIDFIKNILGFGHDGDERELN